MTLSLTYKGLDYPAFYNGGYYYNNSLDGVVSTGANSVAIGNDYGIDAQTSTVYSDPNVTDSLSDLSTTILQAESLGLSVMVRPAIDLVDPALDGTLTYDWRDTYIPADPTAFFNSYETMIVNEASIAQADGAQMLDIGTELDQLTGPQYLSEWTQIISAVRAVYSGALTYSANWDDDLSPWAYDSQGNYNAAIAGTGNIATQISFWNQLDYIGIDQYAPLSDATNPTLQDLINGWTQTPTDPYSYNATTVAANTSNSDSSPNASIVAKISGAATNDITPQPTLSPLSLIQYYENMSAEIGKPLLFSEIGYEDASDGAQNVNYPNGTQDQTLQANAYQAFFDAWEQSGNTSLKGTFFWFWDPASISQGPTAGITFSPQGELAQSVLTAAYSSPDSGPTSSTACYARGTLLATPSGPRLVEALAEGDLMLTASGAARPVKWLGYRAIDCTRHSRPNDVWPVRIRAGAFAPDAPQRDLYLSPEHAVAMVGVLIPIHRLINDTTVAQERRDWVEYWHVELERHDVLLAEGLPCESYLDTGNRSSFSNAPVPALRPSFGKTAASAWSADACAPLVESGPLLDAVSAQLAARARALDFPIPRVHAMTLASSGRISARLPRDVTIVRLLSPAAYLGEDRRRLGALITGLWIDGVSVSLNDPRLVSGFHAIELHGPHPVRWTDGGASIAIGGGTAERSIEIEIATINRMRTHQSVA
jgi:hypothetical protein